MVNLTIDGKKIEVSEGTTVLRAAEAAGVTIPTLCDHPELTPYGGCRLCLVEVEGARTLQPSCTLPVNNNMVVLTDTKRVKAARKFVLTLIFSERNHFCMYCQVSGGDCELQNAAYGEGMTHWPLQPNWQPFEVDASNPHFVLDNNRCILCRRCVRACGELVGNHTLGFEERGAKSFLVADYGTPLGESSCVSCGTCIQVCPTGALIDRGSAYRGREIQVETTTSICTGCSVGCGIKVMTRDNHLVRIEGDWDSPVNNGVLCKEGRFLPVEDDRQRLLTPLIRKNGVQKAATWDEALAEITAHLKPLKGNKAGGVAALASSRLSSEALHQFKQLFSDGLESDMVTSLEEGLSTAIPARLAAESKRSFEGKLDAMQTAGCFVTFGVDLADKHPVLGFFIKRALPAGAKLITVDGENSNPFAEVSDVAIKLKSCSYQDVIDGLYAALLNQGTVKSQSARPARLVEEFASKTGFSVNIFSQAASLIAASKQTIFLYGKDLACSNSGQDLKSLIALSSALQGSVLISTKGQANSFAAVQYGLDQTFELNGHQALFIAAGDEETSQRLLQRIEKTPFLVVQSSHTSRLTTLANVVLPVGTWAEFDGHFVNLEGRIQKSQKSLSPPENVRSNEEAFKSIASVLGLKTSTEWKKDLVKRLPVSEILE